MNSRLFRFDFDRTHFGDHGLESSTISCPADTLYSALCVEALRMGGQQLLGELVACSTLRLTDLLPYVGPDYLVPKPLHSVRSDGSSMQKKLAKKIGFLPAAQLGSFLDGTADLKELAARQTKIGVHAVSAKAAIHNGKKDADPYRVGYFRFELDAGLWLLATGSESELGLLTRLLKGISALGGERTSGFGAFNLTESEAPAALTPTVDAASLMTLTTSLPTDDELEAALAGATYRLVKRSGFVASSTYADMPLRKRDIYKFAAGSVFSRPSKEASSTSAWAETIRSTATRDRYFSHSRSPPHEHLPEAVRTHAAVPGAGVYRIRREADLEGVPRGGRPGLLPGHGTSLRRHSGSQEEVFRSVRHEHRWGTGDGATQRVGRAKRGQAGSC